MSETTVRKHFKKQKIAFFKLKEKPLLETGDLEERKKWADAHKRRTPAQWVTHPQAIIDNKSFQMVTCRKGREFAAPWCLMLAWPSPSAAPEVSSTGATWRKCMPPRDYTVPVRYPYGARTVPVTVPIRCPFANLYCFRSFHVLRE